MMLTTIYLSAGDVTNSAGDVSIFSVRSAFVMSHPVASSSPFCQQWWRQHWFITTATNGVISDGVNIRWRHKRSTFSQQFMVTLTFICHGGHFVWCWHQGESTSAPCT